MRGYLGGAHAGDSEGDMRSVRTRLVQRSVKSLDNAVGQFSYTGANNTEVCLVVTPQPTSICCCLRAFMTNVPSG